MRGMNELKQKIEGILFLSGEPISVKKLASLADVKINEIEEALEELSNDYHARGFRLAHKDGEWQIVTAPEISKTLEKFVQSEYSENLSRAALEVLTIVAYKGPLTRAEVEFIRGVNSVYSLRNLMMRGLIEKKDNPKDGRSHIYSVSFDFLRHCGLTNISELPRYQEFNSAEVPKIPEELLSAKEE
ncbi:MAG: SMC-Scp complex subunit ScpB [Patescibacteria group bacterium]